MLPIYKKGDKTECNN